jgi:hypothetical protein
MRPYSCSDGFCGTDDCFRCHGENFARGDDEEWHYLDPDFIELIAADDSDDEQTDGAEQFQIETIPGVQDELF